MGFSSFFSSVANVYSKMKSGVSEVYNFGKNIIHKGRNAVDWLDEQINKASSIPFIGALIGEGIEELKDTQVFGVSWNRIKRGVDHLDDMVSHSEIPAMAGMVDSFVTSAIEAGQTYGGLADQMFSAGGQTQGGLVF